MSNPSAAARALGEGDPLPPEDRVVRPSSLAMLDQLYRTESPGLLRRLSRRPSNSDEAEDLLQEAFFKLARMSEQLLSLERPQAYLKRIAANLITDRARDEARKEIGIAMAAEDACPPQDPCSLLETRDMLNRIEAAMMRLRPRTREIFMAHRIEGLTYAEIAERTGLTVKGVEKQMSKALRQVDRLMSRL